MMKVKRRDNIQISDDESEEDDKMTTWTGSGTAERRD